MEIVLYKWEAVLEVGQGAVAQGRLHREIEPVQWDLESIIQRSTVLMEAVPISGAADKMRGIEAAASRTGAATPTRKTQQTKLRQQQLNSRILGVQQIPVIIVSDL